MEAYRRVLNALLAMGLAGALVLPGTNAQAKETIVIFQENH